LFIKLYENGYSPIPVYYKGKNPCILEWQKYCSKRATEKQIENWNDDLHNNKINIGVACGEASGIIVIDIDTDDKEFLNSLPPSTVRRRGQKGEARFFRYTPSVPTASFPQLDILSNGRQILVPPSIHPAGMRYEWLTPDTLENTKPEDLPELPLDFLDQIKFKTKDIKIQATGRNNKLVDIVSAMRGCGESETEIIKQVYEWDSMHNKPRLFTDKSEGFKADSESDAKNNVWKFVTSVTKSLIDKGVARMNENLVIELTEEKAIANTLTYPEPTGLVKDIRDLILDYSERDMPNLALGGAVSLMSVICSNRFRFDRCWPNTYVLNLAPTGAGKSFPQKIISMILDERLATSLIGYGNYQSSAAFAKNLVSRRERLDVIDEVSSLFAQMKGGGLWQMGILEEMCKVWSNSNGKYNAAEYSEKEDTSSCFNPCVNVLGSSTIEGIKNNFNKMMVTKGLIPRFLIFSHENYGSLKRDFLNEPLLNSVVASVDKILSIPKNELGIKVEVGRGPVYNPNDVTPSDRDAVEFFAELKLYFANRIESESSENLRSLLTRGKEQVMKLALIHAVGNFRNIEMADLVWAKEVFNVCLNNSSSFIEESAVDSENEKDLKSFLNLFDKKQFITIPIALNRLKRFDLKKLQGVTASLLAAEKIKCAEKTHLGKKISGWVLDTL